MKQDLRPESDYRPLGIAFEMTAAATKKSAKPSKRRVAARKAPAGAARSGKLAHLKLQIELSDGSRLGPGKIMLLEAIDRAGSLSRGAEEMGISYRRAWLFMRQINESFDEPAIETPAGGHGGAPSRLTEFGQRLITAYRKIEAEAERATAREMAWLRRHSR